MIPWNKRAAALICAAALAAGIAGCAPRGDRPAEGSPSEQADPSPDSEIQRLAERYGITQEKAELILAVFHENAGYTFEDLVGRSIEDLNQLLAAPSQAEPSAQTEPSAQPSEAAAQSSPSGAQSAPGPRIQSAPASAPGAVPVTPAPAASAPTTPAPAVAPAVHPDPAASAPIASAPAASAPTYIGEAAAQANALTHAGVEESQAARLRCKLDYDDGRAVYEVEFHAGGMEYDYDVDALTGEIRSFSKESEPGVSQTAPTPAASAPTYIGEAAAQANALTHAGVEESQAARLRCKLDYDDGRAVYEVEFHAGGMEYDYEIDAVSGDVVSFQQERDDRF